jgi:hypothetical protein
VKNGTSAWTADELDQVYAAFGQLSEAEKGAIHDVTLSRERKCQETTAGGEVTAASYTYEIKETGKNQHVLVATMCVSDAAFNTPLAAQSGGTPGVIIHEVGHAIEKRAAKEADIAANTAVDEANRQTETLNASITSENKEFKAARDKYEKWTDAQQTTAGLTAYFRALDRIDKAINALDKWDPKVPSFAPDAQGKLQPVDERGDAEKAADEWLRKREDAWANLVDKQPGHPVLTDYAPVNRAQDEMVKAAKEHARLKAEAQSKNADLEKTLDKLGARTITARLKRFIDFAKANNVPSLSDYTDREWEKAQKSGDYETYWVEMFAEAFRLWKTQRDALKNQSPERAKLVEWFDKGNYLQ